MRSTKSFYGRRPDPVSSNQIVMFLDEFHGAEGTEVKVSADQASRFAKEVADDFNPIHDPDAKRFCVPGDLLFSLVLAKYGLSQRMCFVFTGMVGDGTALSFPSSEAAEFTIDDDAGKSYMTVQREGDISRDPSAIEALTRGYVAFSGRNFPHVLVPLLAEQQVMINPDRPLVIYERMSFQLDHLDFSTPELQASRAELNVKGKRGEAHLHFDIRADGEKVGQGFKKLLLSGLREYDEQATEALIDAYMGWKAAYKVAG